MRRRSAQHCAGCPHRRHATSGACGLSSPPAPEVFGSPSGRIAQGGGAGLSRAARPREPHQPAPSPVRPGLTRRRSPRSLGPRGVGPDREPGAGGGSFGPGCQVRMRPGDPAHPCPARFRLRPGGRPEESAVAAVGGTPDEKHVLPLRGEVVHERLPGVEKCPVAAPGRIRPVGDGRSPHGGCGHEHDRPPHRDPHAGEPHRRGLCLISFNDPQQG
jgi:hypothetical protein